MKSLGRWINTISLSSMLALGIPDCTEGYFCRLSKYEYNIMSELLNITFWIRQEAYYILRVRALEFLGLLSSLPVWDHISCGKIERLTKACLHVCHSWRQTSNTCSVSSSEVHSNPQHPVRSCKLLQIFIQLRIYIIYHPY